jgi:hypothetical protein
MHVYGEVAGEVLMNNHAIFRQCLPCHWVQAVSTTYPTHLTMRILELKAMRGPNYWSVKRHNLIVMRLDIEDLEQKPTDKIPGFYERIQACCPACTATAVARTTRVASGNG